MRNIVLLLLVVTACVAAHAAPPTPTRTVDEVRATGSLRGTELDGAWAAPGRAREAEAQLLRRFDHLLTAVGETGLPELRRYIDREVTREHGALAAQEALAAWEAHLAVLRVTPQTQNADTPAPEPTTRAPRKPAATPRLLLTPDKPVTDSGAQDLHAQRVSHFGAAAAERLRVEDEARWSWKRRLEEAAKAVQGQPPAAQAATLAQRFSGTELLRARTLLGLPPG